MKLKPILKNLIWFIPVFAGCCFFLMKMDDVYAASWIGFLLGYLLGTIYVGVVIEQSI